MAAPFDEILAFILALDARSPDPRMPACLDGLFKKLSELTPCLDAREIENRIWDVWTTHPDPQLQSRMNEAIAAIAARRFPAALSTLDDIVMQDPGWAEAWNKRATLLFIMEDDLASVRDIEQTLRLEPRHFGAVAGFGQICLRNGEPVSAVAAFQTALRLNPHLTGVRIAVEELKRCLRGRLH